MSTVVRSRFHVYAAFALAATIVAGFGRTYYFKYWFDTPPLTQLLHIHAIVFTGWLALHFTQAKLIAAHRVATHKRLGIATAIYGYGMFVLGVVTSIAVARTGVPIEGIASLPFTAVPIITILVFAGFLTAALWMRRRADWHKRFMLLATISLLAPATARLSKLFLGHLSPAFPLLITLGFVVWCWIDDKRKLGKVHPAYVIGGVLLMLSLPLRFLLTQSAAWESFARWMVGSG
jgi:hypothetical protein